ncbi:MAG TPA: undecaprenyl-phosphate glucose phosphotransferase [Beijerinckiaceae bacterium]|nr:undecaprenyl-phosphate glucose phosphotransferase [Beijerinckiaceae bacterium]
MVDPRSSSASEATPAPGLRLAETVAGLTPRSSTSPAVIMVLARLGEALVIMTVGVLAIYLYIPASEPLKGAYWIAVPGAALLTVAMLQMLGLYRISALQAPLVHGPKVAGGVAAVFLLMLAIMFFLKLEGGFSRGVFSLWLAGGLISLLLARIAIAMVVRGLLHSGALERRAVIVGGGDYAEQLIEAFAASPDSGITLCGLFDERNDPRSPDLVAGYPKLGGIDDLVAYARTMRIDLIIFSLPVTAEARILSMLAKLWVLPADIRLAAHMQRLKFRPRNYSYIGSLPMFDIADKPFSEWDLIIKSAFDRIVAALLILLLAPVMATVALAVRLDSRGPVLFRQKRYGFNNQLIEVFKFRSMHVDQLDANASRLVTRGDPRVTRVGRFIRRTSLDELPQLFNVLTGELSLVGPRPHAVHAKAEDRLYDEVVDGYFARHKVKPGITGWAQINGWRGETDTAEKIQKRVEHDLYYIENWSVLFDLYILAMTPVALLQAKNAY